MTWWHGAGEVAGAMAVRETLHAYPILYGGHAAEERLHFPLQARMPKCGKCCSLIPDCETWVQPWWQRVCLSIARHRNVGDSRAYLLRDGCLHITEDRDLMKKDLVVFVSFR